jgi:lysine 6-dehydrogenase
MVAPPGLALGENGETRMRFLVIGAGKQGSACAFDLLHQPGVRSVLLADKDFAHLPAFLKPLVGDRLELRRVDLTDTVALRASMRGVNSVLSAAPYYFNLELAELAVEAGAHFADLGGNTEIVFKQKELFESAVKRGCKIVPDCGLAPGMVNILTAEGIHRLDTAESAKMYVGGLPQQPEPPLNYMVVYSLEGALDYYSTPSWILREGQPQQVDALSELEDVEFPAPLGQLEAFHTAGGVSTMPFVYQGKLKTMEYKTLRYPGHVAIMKPIRDLGLFDMAAVDVKGQSVVPRDVFISVVSPKITRPQGRDYVVLRVEVQGTKGGKPATARFQLVDRYDAENQISAMMRTTGYSLAITGLMQVDGRIQPAGVHTPDECVPGVAYIEELKKRGVVIEESFV